MIRLGDSGTLVSHAELDVGAERLCLQFDRPARGGVLERVAREIDEQAVQLLRDRCPKITAPLRTPVDPSSRGFLIVWVLHANHAPPATLMAGENAPATAEAINESFLRGVEALHTMAANF